MPARNIIVGQAVTAERHARAKELRSAMTPEERMVWERVRANRFHGLSIRRQQIIDGFIVDVYGHQAGICIEIDGSVHNDRQEYDAQRDAILRDRGLTILRFSNDDVRKDRNGVLRKIVVACVKKLRTETLPSNPLPGAAASETPPPNPSPKRGGGWETVDSKFHVCPDKPSIQGIDL